MEVTTALNISHNTVTGSKVQESSSYMNNMLLPEMVQSSRKNPLGPDCQITHKEVTDQEVLKNFDFYWYISHEKGCVECQIRTCELSNRVTTVFPQCIITRKCRRFEAYGCAKCRSHFVTVVQALLHVKALHRANNKILIHDLNVFHDIDKAMEIPPVPLPWYVLKKKQEEPLLKQLIPKGVEQSSTANGEDHVPQNHARKSSEEETTSDVADIENGHTLSPALLSAASKALKRDRPSKTVRFTVGNPDSDDDESGSGSERSDHESSSNSKNKDDTGLKGVVDNLLTTASNISRISPVDPKLAAKEEATKLTIVTTVVPSIIESNIVNTTASIVRVQSWAGMPTSMPSRSYGYTEKVLSPTTHQLTAPGRAYTYAEKIRMMKHMNDRDEAITKEHMRGKLSESASTPSLTAMHREAESKKKKHSRSSHASKDDNDIVFNIDKDSLIAKPKSKRKTSHSSVDDGASKVKYTRYEESSDGEMVDGDDSKSSIDQPASFLQLIKDTNASPISTSATTNTLSSSSSSSSFQPMVPESHDYYGQGEWAVDARKTLKTIQSSAVNSSGIQEAPAQAGTMEISTITSFPLETVVTSSIAREEEIKTETETSKPSTALVKINSAPVDVISSDSDESERTPFVTKRTVIYPPTSDKNKNNIINKAPKSQLQKILGLNKKCSSDPALSKRDKIKVEQSIPEGIPENEKPIANKGDVLQLLEDIQCTSTDVNLKCHALTRLRKPGSVTASTDDKNNSMNMPQLFENSVATFFKVKVVEKWSVCCVCGFKVQCSVEHAANDEELEQAIKAHVMEHSLKEILQIGYKMKQK